MIKKLLLILLLLPVTASAKDCEKTLNTCTARINETELQAAIQAQAPDAKLYYDECQSATAINGVIQPGTEKPAKVTVTGVPDAVACSQVWTFLQNHNPTETTQEERQRKRIEAADAKLQQLPSYQDLLTRIQALEARP